MRLWHHVLDWLFPHKCILCRKVLERGETDLCSACRIDSPECTDFSADYSFISSWYAVWRYENQVRESLLRYKFYGKRGYAHGYGRLLAMGLQARDMTDFDLLTYIPISKKRLRKRGFDQVRLLTQYTAGELGMTYTDTLRKVRHNKPQSGIHGDAHRRANVLGAYEVAEGVDLTGKRILLLDDIVTTGATASECARVLLTAGAKEVHLAVIATADHQNKTSR